MVFSKSDYLNTIENRFSKNVVEHINEMTSKKLKGASWLKH